MVERQSLVCLVCPGTSCDLTRGLASFGIGHSAPKKPHPSPDIASLLCKAGNVVLLSYLALNPTNFSRSLACSRRSSGRNTGPASRGEVKINQRVRRCGCAPWGMRCLSTHLGEEAAPGVPCCLGLGAPGGGAAPSPRGPAGAALAALALAAPGSGGASAPSPPSPGPGRPPSGLTAKLSAACAAYPPPRAKNCD